MKWFAIFLVLIGITVVAAWYFSNPNSQIFTPSTPTPMAVSQEPVTFVVKGETYAAHFVQIEKLDQVSLFPNFIESTSLWLADGWYL